MKAHFRIQKKEKDSWKTIQELGNFLNAVEANEKIYECTENKNDIWEHYRIISIETNK